MRLTAEQEHVIDRVSVNNAYSLHHVQRSGSQDTSDVSWRTRRQKCIFMMDREPRAVVMISLRGVRQRRPDSVREISRQAKHDILAHLPRVCVPLAVVHDTR